MGRVWPERGDDSCTLWIGMGASLLIHAGLAAWIFTAEPAVRDEALRVEITVIEPPTPLPATPTPPRNEPTTTPKPAPVPPRPKPPVPKAPISRPEPRLEPRPEAQKPTPTTTTSTPASGGGARSFGIRLENTVQAAPGTGIAVPTGDTLAADPAAPRPKKPGTGDGTGEGAPEPVTAPLASVKTRPKLLSDSVAAYPMDVRRLGIQGRVVLELVVDEEGRVVRSRVVKSLHPRLDEAALAASKGLRFSPATVDNTPTTVKIPYNYVFVLD